MKTIFGGFFLIVLALSVPAAEIMIPRFEMVTLGRTENNEFSLASAISLDLALSGGYKYGLSLGFSFDSGNLLKTLAYRNFQFGTLPGDPVTVGDYNGLVDAANDRLRNQGVLAFRTARATIRDLFTLPLELTYFIGQGDEFCSGDEFTARFGYPSIGTHYKGLFYFPGGIGGDMNRRYYGIYQPSGTGFALALTQFDFFVPMLYAYESFSPLMYLTGATGDAFYSGDIRFLVSLDNFKMEAFGGLSYNNDFIVRGGVLVHFNAGEEMEFLFQGGISGWKTGSELNIDNFYFLMEPRFRFGIFGLYGTFFYHPVLYNNFETPGERGKADINLKAFVEIPDTNFSTGFESTAALKIDRLEDFSFQVSPFLSFAGSGMRWDAKVRFNILGAKLPEEFFELFVGVSTSF